MQLIVIKKILILKLIKINDNKKRESLHVYLYSHSGWSFSRFPCHEAYCFLAKWDGRPPELNPHPQLPFWNFLPVTSEVGQHPLRPLGGERH